jgi:hypothetical protein
MDFHYREHHWYAMSAHSCGDVVASSCSLQLTTALSLSLSYTTRPHIKGHGNLVIHGSGINVHTSASPTREATRIECLSFLF